MPDELECRLEAEPEYRLGQEITIRFTLTNPKDYSVWVLKWNTPLEGILSNHFRVTRDNQLVRYDGIFIKRGDPGKDQYVRLGPGDTVSSTVDLSTAYPIDQTGQYHAGLDLRIHDIVRETDDGVEIPRPRDVHEALKLSCNEVEFRVVAGGTPRLTEGQRARANETPASRGKDIALESEARSTVAITPVIQGCSSDQQIEVLSAHAGAYFKTLAAIENLNADPSNSLSVTWFGAYDSSRSQTVLNNYTAISNALVTDQFTYMYKGPKCSADWYAYTFRGTTTIYLCNLFWNQLPTSNDSQTETVVHELSHAAAFTSDYAYGTTSCKDLAKIDPSDAIWNADSYGYFTNYVPAIDWGASTKYDTGSPTSLAVAMDDSGNIVEVHGGGDSPENHYYMVGKLNASSKTITWGESIKYDTGSALAVAMDNSGNVVEVHRGFKQPENHYYRVGKLNASSKTITWSESIKYDTGSTLRVAMNNSGKVVEVHCGYKDPENQYYLVGTLDAANQTITWGPSIHYGTGLGLAIAIDDSGNVVELHSGYSNPDNHYYFTGTLAGNYINDDSLTTIDWGSIRKYDTGSRLEVAMDNSGNVVDIHCGSADPKDHHYVVGKVVFPG